MAFGGYIGTTGTRGGPLDVIEVRKAHNLFLQRNDLQIRATLEEVAEHAIMHARRTTEVKIRTREMALGWKKTPAQQTALGLIVSFYSNVKHAFFHEYGTGLWGPSHDYIRPKRSSCLRWIDPDTGDERFAKKVKGVPPKFIGKTSWFQAGVFEGPAMFERSLGRVASRF